MRYFATLTAVLVSLVAAANQNEVTLDLVTGATASVSMDMIYSGKDAYFDFILK